MSEPIAFALIGCGGMGRRHIFGLAELDAALARIGRGPLLRLEVVIDRVRERAITLSDEVAHVLGYRPAVHTDLSALPRARHVAAIDIATATESHDDLGLEAIAAGYHTLVEKPLATTIRRASRLMEEAEKNNVILAVAENVRREPVNRFARAFVQSGLLGEVRFVLDMIIGGSNAILLTPWRHQRQTGGIMLDVAVHRADVLEYLAGPVEHVIGLLRLDEPVRVRPDQSPVASAAFYAPWVADLSDHLQADAEDVGLALLTFTCGAAGQWTIHQAAHGKHQAQRILYGSTGSLELPADRSGGEPVFTPSRGQPVSGPDLLALVPDYRLSEMEAVIWGQSRPTHVAADFATIDRKLVAVELADFARAIHQAGPPEVDGHQARRNMALVYALAESAVAGQPMAVDDVERGVCHAYQDRLDAAMQAVGEG